MRIGNVIATLALLLIAAESQAQLYKWVAPDGSVTYSDTPPPASVAKVERKSYSGGGSLLAGLPYELAQIAKGNPVSLYTTPNCPPCDSGRKLLTERGIPFAEKTVTGNDDIERVRQLTGSTQLPLLVVGRAKQSGFEAGQWGNALTAAGYPASSQLPGSYSNPPPEPAAPKVAAASDGTQSPPKTNADQSGIVQPPPAAGNAPPGFQF